MRECGLSLPGEERMDAGKRLILMAPEKITEKGNGEKENQDFEKPHHAYPLTFLAA
jgi:hypothetical protein